MKVLLTVVSSTASATAQPRNCGDTFLPCPASPLHRCRPVFPLARSVSIAAQPRCILWPRSSGGAQRGPAVSQPFAALSQSRRGVAQPLAGLTQSFCGVAQRLPGLAQPLRGAYQSLPGSVQPLRGTSQPSPGLAQSLRGAVQPLRDAYQPLRGAPKWLETAIFPSKWSSEPFVAHKRCFHGHLASVLLSGHRSPFPSSR